jgi:hypothetical protein
MALALNQFQTIAQSCPNTDTEIYEAPIGYTGVVLLAQVTNVGITSSHDVSLSHRREVGGVDVDTRMLLNYPIPAGETANLLTGKLVLESGDGLVISSSDGVQEMNVVISILETLN